MRDIGLKIKESNPRGHAKLKTIYLVILSMDYKEYPLPIIDLINKLDNWSTKQLISFERSSIKQGGFIWKSTYNDDFEFSFNIQIAKSSELKNVFAFNMTGTPGDLITYDSRLSIPSLIINFPYTLDIEKLLQERLQKQFDLWIDRVNTFETKTLFGQVPLHNYEKDFFDSFEILEDDANVAPFDHKRQILIEEMVDKTITILLMDKNESNSAEIDHVIEFGKDLKSKIPRTSKNQVLKKLSTFYAKIRSIGAQLSFEVLKHLTVEGVKAIIQAIP